MISPELDLNISPNESFEDPNVLQHRAANPESCVWVSASAGTGKTKVLTDRVMRLLLPGSQGQKATPAYKILCLTFTKAGAAEMHERITGMLSDWVIQSDTELIENLSTLLGGAPTVDQVTAARQLFAQVVDVPGGLKIMTIHAFCQSLLGRFPLEAGLMPGFEAIDETVARKTQSQIVTHLLGLASSSEDHPIAPILSRLLRVQNMEQIAGLLDEIILEKAQFARVISKMGGLEVFSQKIYETLSLTIGITAEKAYGAYFREIEKLDVYADALIHGASKDQRRSAFLKSFVEMDLSQKIAVFDDFKEVFLKKTDGKPNAGPAKGTLKAWEGADVYHLSQSAVLMDLIDQLNAIAVAEYTCDLMALGYGVLELYEAEKQKQGWLDFDDLILRAKNLLNGQSGSAAWVMYKLDGGIDHLLVDEAQDTNPDQWDVISSLVEEFYTGFSAREDINRSLFVVGDDKQSIFSFQRADSEVFEKMAAFFERQTRDALKDWAPIALNTSFRSTQAVLDVVDAVFEKMKTRHKSFRKKQAGRVELWPLYEAAPKELLETWHVPIKVRETASPMEALAHDIARQIATWLKDKTKLPSRDRAIEPGDIMILFRSRNALFNQVIRALKRMKVPVSGVDRMIVKDQLAVEDLHSLCRFAILPEDDLNLACVLKTPLIGLSEEEVFASTHNRGDKSVWAHAKHVLKPEVIKYLSALLEKANTATPYEFLCAILYTPCPADAGSGLRALQKRLGQDVLDPIEECLNGALEYEQNNTANLQDYLAYIEDQNAPIKREHASSDNVVRIMTAHGSKGLQAPIVFLPDTIQLPQHQNKTSNLLWPNRSSADVPLWAPRRDLFSSYFEDLYTRVQGADSREYDRLLYVALTRAEDWLIVAGYNGHAKALDNSWYFQVEQAFENLEATHEPFETEYDSAYLSNTKKTVYAQKQNARPDRTKREIVSTESNEYDLPDWVSTPPKAEPKPPRPLMPSRPSVEDEIVHSPLRVDSQDRFRRGNLTHALLQYLPNLPKDQWRRRADLYLQSQAGDMSASFRESVAGETVAVMSHPDFEAIFTAPNLAEAGVTALQGNKAISGQIDRIAFVEGEIWIIDYKTNRPPPSDVKDVPRIYKNQMASYAELLTQIYPDTKIRTYLLWTDGLYLMELV